MNKPIGPFLLQAYNRVMLVPRLRLAEFAVALSLASDLGLGHPLEMVLASCLLSLRLAWLGVVLWSPQIEASQTAQPQLAG